jgi:hypothetical protein
MVVFRKVFWWGHVSAETGDICLRRWMSNWIHQGLFVLDIIKTESEVEDMRSSPEIILKSGSFGSKKFLTSMTSSTCVDGDRRVLRRILEAIDGLGMR